MKKSRKKILLSSIAMLLVALVALGSATFAWFSLNKSVTADGMTVKAASSKGLQISIDNGDSWAASKTFTALNQILTPVSLDYSTTTSGTTAYNEKLNGTPYYPDTVNGDNGAVWTSGSADVTGWQSDAAIPTNMSNTAGVEGATSNDYFMAYEVGIKGIGLADGEAFGGIKAQVTYTDTTTGTKKISEFARVALVKQASTSQNLTNDTLKAVIGSEASPNAISAIDTVATDAQKLDTAGTDISLDNVGTTETWYTLYIWLEGQDGQCLNNHMAAEGTVSITFTSTGVTSA